jgi:hypothetical protein
MVGGCLAHHKPLTCSFQRSCHKPLVHRTGLVPRTAIGWHSKQTRTPSALRVAQQLGDTPTGVGTAATTAADSQQLEDELRESIEQEVPVVGGLLLLLLWGSDACAVKSWMTSWTAAILVANTILAIPERVWGGCARSSLASANLLVALGAGCCCIAGSAPWCANRVRA